MIAYKDAFFDDKSKSLCMVMEFADEGDLLSHIKKRATSKPRYFKEEYIWTTFFQICWGIAALHQLDILHRDLKSANIFLTKQEGAKIGDLNVSKVMQEGFL